MCPRSIRTICSLPVFSRFLGEALFFHFLGSARASAQLRRASAADPDPDPGPRSQDPGPKNEISAQNASDRNRFSSVLAVCLDVLGDTGASRGTWKAQSSPGGLRAMEVAQELLGVWKQASRAASRPPASSPCGAEARFWIPDRNGAAHHPKCSLRRGPQAACTCGGARSSPAEPHPCRQAVCCPPEV